MKEFSAKYFMDMFSHEFEKEAENLGVDLYGKSRTQQIDAVYNAELRRRQLEAEQSMLPELAPDKLAEETESRGVEPVKPDDESDEIDDYESMTVPQLRDEAKKRGVDLGDATRRDDIIAVLTEADEDQE